MGAYRWSHVVQVPSLLSLARIPLAVAFAWVERPAVWVTLLVVAGFTDVADGWYARRYHQVTPTGAVIDPITDKLFVTTVVITLIAHDVLPLWMVVALSTRELGELPLVIWFAVSRDARQARAESAQANVLGKLATTLQFTTIAAALFAIRGVAELAVVTAAAGAIAAASYWRRLGGRTPKAPHGGPTVGGHDG